jgi:hypothetical protein
VLVVTDIEGGSAAMDQGTVFLGQQVKSCCGVDVSTVAEMKKALAGAKCFVTMKGNFNNEYVARVSATGAAAPLATAAAPLLRIGAKVWYRAHPRGSIVGDGQVIRVNRTGTRVKLLNHEGEILKLNTKLLRIGCGHRENCECGGCETECCGCGKCPNNKCADYCKCNCGCVKCKGHLSSMSMSMSPINADIRALYHNTGMDQQLTFAEFASTCSNP